MADRWPGRGTELPRDRPCGSPQACDDAGRDWPVAGRGDKAHRTHRAPEPVAENGREAALPEHGAGGNALSPSVGLAVFIGYNVVLVAAAGALLKRRDA